MKTEIAKQLAKERKAEKRAARKERMKKLHASFRATGFVSLRDLCEANGQKVDFLGEVSEVVN